MIRLELKALAGSNFSELQLDRLRFFLSGDPAMTNRLYELIFNHVSQVVVRAGPSTAGPPAAVLPPSSLQAVGFSPDEGILPYGARSFLGYRLLCEYFCFPSKFMFVDIAGLEAARRASSAIAWKSCCF